MKLFSLNTNLQTFNNPILKNNLHWYTITLI